jgi:MFS family permease
MIDTQEQPLPRHALAVPQFRLYWSVRVLSTLAIQMQTIAVGWQVYDLARRTHDPHEAAWYLGLVGLAIFVPLFGFALPAGQLADRFSRRAILLACLVLEMVSMAGLFLLSQQPDPSLTLIFACLAVMGTARAFFAPAAQSLAPNLVPRPLLPSAIALSSMAWQGAAIVGPALGGYLYATGAPVVYGTAFVLLAMSFGLVLAIVVPPRQTNPEPITLQTLLGGIRFVRSQPLILGSISLDLFAVLFGGATALLPAYARDVLAIGPEGLGHLRMAPAIGAALVALWLARRPLQGQVGKIMFLSVGLFGLATIIFGISTWFWLSMAMLVLLGAADMISIYVRSSLIQLNTPDAMRGRVSAVSNVFISASNELGEFQSGVAARLIGIVPAVVVGGVIAIGVTVLWARLFPQLYAADRLDQGRSD